MSWSNANLAIEAVKLTKRFGGPVPAVSGLDLSVRAGAVFGLMGRNGAGKTTTLRLLLGLLRPDAGEARVLGHSLWTAPSEVRQRVAYVPQVLQLPTWMTLTELCRYLSHFYTRWDAALGQEFAARWELPRHRPLASLSGGEQRLAALVTALASRPEVLVLDEPGAGLDPIARRELLSAIVDALTRSEPCTILFSTHQIGDLERVATHVGMMHRGRLTTSMELDALLSTVKRVQVVFDSPEPPADFGIPGALRSRVSGPVVNAVVRLVSQGQLDPVRAVRGARVQVFDLGLEEMFIELFSQEPVEDFVLGI